MKERVLLGVSGGVDSSVSALRLKNMGYEVVGIYIKNHDIEGVDNNLLDAKEVCDKLGIEFHSIDLKENNDKYVFNYFIDEYKNGRTPSPCIVCNRKIKFKAFIDMMDKYNANYIAMGHYARIERKDGITYLLRGSDLNKDQTYFLSMLPQSILKYVLFPVGDLEKPEVRKIALENNLVTARKKDSQDICFVGKEKFKDFLSKYIKDTEGQMQTLDGKVIGHHQGLQYYTIGQRKGLNIGGSNEFLNDAWFVLGKDLEKNILYVGQGFDNEYLYSNRCICKNYNFNSIPLDESKTYLAKFRYRSKLIEVKVKIIDETTLEITYLKDRAVTPGQFAVFYDDKYCLGGAVIDKVYMNDLERKY
jgi:tRNA-specific 2-thiouridylase